MVTQLTRPHRTTTRHLPGEPGAWVFILGDLAVFAVLFGVYLSYRARAPEVFKASQETLDQSYGAINTLLLLTSSLFVAAGVSAIRARFQDAAPWMFAGAFACGVGFAAMKLLEYSQKIEAGLTPGTNDFFMYYYILTGLHFFHLLIGMVVLAFLFGMARANEVSDKRFSLIEGGACFWHMVDLLWIILFPLLYFVR